MAYADQLMKKSVFCISRTTLLPIGDDKRVCVVSGWPEREASLDLRYEVHTTTECLLKRRHNALKNERFDGAFLTVPKMSTLCASARLLELCVSSSGDNVTYIWLFKKRHHHPSAVIERFLLSIHRPKMLSDPHKSPFKSEEQICSSPTLTNWPL